MALELLTFSCETLCKTLVLLRLESACFNRLGKVSGFGEIKGGSSDKGVPKTAISFAYILSDPVLPDS